MGYRDDLEALDQREAELVAELRALQGRMKAASRLCGEEARLRGELEELRAAMPPERRLPTVDRLRSASPCQASWEAMAGDHRLRHCHGCGKSVYNLEAMTQREAMQVLARSRELCMPLRRRADGTFITGDCPEGSRRRRSVGIAVAVAGAGLFAFEYTEQPRDYALLGAVAPPRSTRAESPAATAALSPARMQRLEEAFGDGRAMAGRRDATGASTIEPLAAAMVQKLALPRALLEELLALEYSPLRGAPAIPEKGGLRLLRVNTAFEQLGLRSGDVVETVNGHSTVDPASALAGPAELRTAERIVVELDRAGTRVVLIYEVGD